MTFVVWIIGWNCPECKIIQKGFPVCRIMKITNHFDYFYISKRRVCMLKSSIILMNDLLHYHPVVIMSLSIGSQMQILVWWVKTTWIGNHKAFLKNFELFQKRSKWYDSGKSNNSLVHLVRLNTTKLIFIMNTEKWLILDFMFYPAKSKQQDTKNRIRKVFLDPSNPPSNTLAANWSVNYENSHQFPGKCVENIDCNTF